MRDDRARLFDMREAIERIEKYATSREILAQNELVQTWTLYYLQVIGEAARSLSDDFRGRHPEIPWSDVIGMRNVLAHRYFGIDVGLVWDAVERGLPDLKRKVEAILRELGGAAQP
jgi:uncharacterized protein with HEPN domain